MSATCLCPDVRAPDRRSGERRGCRRSCLHRGRRGGQLLECRGVPRRPPDGGGKDRDHRVARTERTRETLPCSTSSGTGSSPASATGASRSRSSIYEDGTMKPLADERTAAAAARPEEVPAERDHGIAPGPCGGVGECHGPRDRPAGRRETNTMPQWAGSCWYYLRFIDPANDTDVSAIRTWSATGCRSICTSAERSTPCST